MTILGWFVINWFDSCRDRNNKLRDLKTEYLIDAYVKIASGAGTNMYLNDPKYQEDFRSALINIQLFGSEKEIELIQNAINKKTINDSIYIIDLDPILFELRKSLRDELNITQTDKKIQWINFQKNN